MSVNDETYALMLAQLQGVAKALRDEYGFTSVQICGCVHMEQASETTAVFAGSGSAHERWATTREYVMRNDLFVHNQFKGNS